MDTACSAKHNITKSIRISSVFTINLHLKHKYAHPRHIIPKVSIHFTRSQSIICQIKSEVENSHICNDGLRSSRKKMMMKDHSQMVCQNK